MVVTAGSCRMLAQPLLGCNVYISAGGLCRHGPILLDLLQETQDRCSRLQLQASAQEEVCVVVHAFSDAVYNRSSIHLAGSEGMLSSVVAELVRDAQGRLIEDKKQERDSQTSSNKNSSVAHHPYVGLVDHVSVMPLEPPEESISNANDGSTDNVSNINNSCDNFIPTTAWGRAARAIGTSMTLSNTNTEVFYYGSADPHNTPLAEVRRTKTKFFQSGGLDPTLSTRTANTPNQGGATLALPKKDVATVGASSTFVENFNIRLTRNCDKKMAQSLTRWVRERDGGLPGVEALTLPYSDGRFEAACNLLQPKIGSAEAIQEKVQEWAATMMAKQPEAGLDLDYFVATSYRVGTTAEQCLSVLELVSQSNSRALEAHNMNVRSQLEGYLHTA